MHKLLAIIAGILVGISLVTGIVFTVAELITHDKSFYMEQAKKNDSITELGVSAPDYQLITARIVSYLEGNAPNLDISVQISGENNEVFTPIEKSHMADVRNIFQVGSVIRWYLFALMAVLLLAISLNKSNEFCVAAAKAATLTIYVFFAFGALLAVIASLDFYSAFTLFHKVLFTNNNWLLPDTCSLIIMLPLEFFIAAACKLAFWTVLLLAIALTGLIIIARKGNPIALKRGNYID